jgi:hypothetical protein
MSDKDSKTLKTVKQSAEMTDVPDSSNKISKVIKNPTEEEIVTETAPLVEEQSIKEPSMPVPKVQKTRKLSKDVNMSAPKLTDYRCYFLSNLKNVYLKLLNDNITYMLEYIYTNKDKEPYNSPEVRVALAMQMILSSDKLIPISLSSMIAKDLEMLRKDDDYTSKWLNPVMKRKRLLKELEMLKKHTEIDDSISLNLPDKKEIENKVNIEDFDIHSGLSTLNVSASCPIEEDNRGNCSLM